jgi:hypothetical protein
MAKFDLEQTHALAKLFEVEADQRDDAWQQKFYAAVPEATLMAFDPHVSQGPDMFPYFALAIPDPGPVTPFCIAHILDDVLNNGYGAVIWGDSSRSGAPEWVFSYGDLLSYSMHGQVDTGRAQAAAPAPEVAGKARQVLVASPSEEYLPARARRAMGGYVRQYIHLPHPKIALVTDPKLNPAQSLMINLTLGQYDGDERTLHAAIGYLRWFLPHSYSLMPMPDDWDDSNFAPLS